MKAETSMPQNAATSTPTTFNKYARPYVDPSVISNNEKILRQIGCSEFQVKLFRERRYEALSRWVRRRIKRMRRENKQKEWGTINPGPGQKAFYMSKSHLPYGPEKAKGAKA